MVIPKRQWQRRLRAALELRGKQLKDLPHIDGFPKKAAARANREADDYVASDLLAEGVARVLDLPVEWFTVADFNEWLTTPTQGGADQLDRIEDMLKRLLNQAQAAPAEGDDLAEAAGEALDQLGEDDDAVDPPPE